MRFKEKIQEKQRLKVHQQDDSKKTGGLPSLDSTRIYVIFKGKSLTLLVFFWGNLDYLKKIKKKENGVEIVSIVFSAILIQSFKGAEKIWRSFIIQDQELVKLKSC